MDALLGDHTPFFYEDDPPDLPSRIRKRLDVIATLCTRLSYRFPKGRHVSFIICTIDDEDIEVDFGTCALIPLLG